MANFRPSAPFNVAMKLIVPITSDRVSGAAKKTYSVPEKSELIFGSFRTFGGTESIKDGVYTTINTGVVNTWYRPDIKADCKIYLCDTEQYYDIVSDPEDIDFRHQYMQFKVQKIGGKA